GSRGVRLQMDSRTAGLEDVRQLRSLVDRPNKCFLWPRTSALLGHPQLRPDDRPQRVGAFRAGTRLAGSEPDPDQSLPTSFSSTASNGFFRIERIGKATLVNRLRH